MSKRRSWPKLLVGVVTSSLISGSLAVVPSAAVAVAAPSPALPKAMTLPASAIVPSWGSVGYLPSSSNVSPAGQFTFAIPLDVPAGRAGMQPSLSLNYAGGTGDGYEGLGWSLTGSTSSITRCATRPGEGAGPRHGVHYDWYDSFCLDGQTLVRLGAFPNDQPPLFANAEYRVESSGFDQVLSSTSEQGAALIAAGGPDSFTVRMKDGRIRTYTAQTGMRKASGVGFPNGTAATGDTSSSSVRALWLLTSEVDRSANEVDYQYTVTANGAGDEFLPSRITYTSHSAKGTPLAAARYVQFDYEARPDPSSVYVGGVRFNTSQRLKTVRMFAPNPGATGLVWQYNLGYGADVSGRSLLTSVAKCGPSGGCLRAKTFTWDSSRRSAVPSFTESDLGPAAVTTGALPVPSMRVMDVNGDGADDLVWNPGVAGGDELRLSSRDAATGALSALSDVRAMKSDPVWPGSTDLVWSRPTDLNTTGAASLAVMYTDAEDNWHQKMLSWDPVGKHFLDDPASDGTVTSVMADVDGDGRADQVWSSPSNGVYYLTWAKNLGGGSFAPPQQSVFPVGVPSVLGGPNKHPSFTCDVKVADPTGEGRSSLIGPRYDSATHGCSQDEFVVSMDVNGDPGVPQPGSVTDGSGVTWHHVLPTVAGYRTVAGDFNGDGLEDYLLLPAMNPGKPAVMLWNTGDGLALEPHTPQLSYDGWQDVRTADLDGDGRTDLVVFTANATTAYMSEGDGTFVAGQIVGDGGTMDPNTGWSTSQVGAFDGTGRPGVVRVSGGRMKLLAQAQSFPDRIVGVRDEGTNWDRETVTYSTAWSDHMERTDPAGGDSFSCAYPQICLRTGTPVVRQVDSRAAGTDPGKGQSPIPYTIQYSYEDPTADVTGRGFLGFGAMFVWDPQRPVETEYDFPHRTEVDGRFYPYVDRPATVTTTVPILDQQGVARHPATATARVTRTHSTYEVRHLNQGATDSAYAVFPAADSAEEWEQPVTVTWGSLVGTSALAHVGGISEPAIALKRTDTSAVFDDYGNKVHSVSSVTDGSSTVTDTTFDNRIADWLITLPTAAKVTSTTAGQMSADRSTSARYDESGRLTDNFVEEGGAADVALHTAYTVDVYGVVTATTVSAAGMPDRVSHAEFQPVWANQPFEEIYPSQTWSEHSVASARPSTWLATHPGYGVTVDEMDANGVQTTATFDDLGRPVTTSPDGQGTTTYTYGNRPDTGGGINGTLTTATTGAAGQMPYVSTTAADALGRRLTVTETGFDGSQHTTTTAYDVLGRTAATTVPAPGGTTGWSYDSLDRPVVTALPDNSTTHNTYTFTTTSAFDAQGDQTDTVHDLDGQVVRVTRGVGSSAVTTTTYSYAPFGQAYQATDDKGHTTTFTYDKRGRQSKVDDPNRGITTDTYYATGDLKTETHEGTGVYTTYGNYDDLGRAGNKTTPDGESTYTYDTAAHGIGKLAAATSPDKIRTDYRYDTAGRTTGTDYTDEATGAVYNTDQTWDPVGRPATMTYPADVTNRRHSIASGYNGFGALNTLTDTTPGQNNAILWTVNSRKPDQSLDTATFGSGTGAVTLKNTYDSPSGRLHNIAVTNPGSGTIEDLTYFYDADGRVKSREDSVANRIEGYTFDATGQLTGWNLADAAQPALSTAYTYDTIGDLTKITLNGATLATYGYGKPDGTQPNTQTTYTPAGQTTQVAGYDGQGRQLTGDGRTTAYTPNDLPKSVVTRVGGGRTTATTTFAYDAFGHKVKETTGNSSTFYIPGLYEHRTTGTTVADVYYVSSPDGPVAQVVTTGNAAASTTATEYTATGPDGSTTAVFGADGKVTENLYYDPFGTAVNADGTSATPLGDVTRQYTGQESDPRLRLINMNGRVYDPAQHGFLTPDPLSAAGTSPYSYAHNDPVNYTDPTGFLECDANCTRFWDSMNGGSLGDFFGAAEAYGNGGAQGLNGYSIGSFRDSTWSDYIGHVRYDQDVTNTQNLNRWMQQITRSDSTETIAFRLSDLADMRLADNSSLAATAESSVSPQVEQYLNTRSLADAGKDVVIPVAPVTEILDAAGAWCAAQSTICFRALNMAAALLGLGAAGYSPFPTAPPPPAAAAGVETLEGAASKAVEHGIRDGDDINAVDGFRNCVSCAISADLTEGGSPAQAVGDNVVRAGRAMNAQDLVDYVKSAGVTPKLIKIETPEQATALLRIWGPGSRTFVIGLEGSPDTGHVWNGFNRGGTPALWDFQPRSPNLGTSWDMFRGVYLLRTTK